MKIIATTIDAGRGRRRRWIGTCTAIIAGALLAGALPATALAAATPTFEIVSPKADSTVTDPVKLDIAVQGVAIGTPSTGDDHLHVSIDGGPTQAVYHNRVFDLKLPPGKHTIGVELAYPTHAPVMAPKFVTFTVRAE